MFLLGPQSLILRLRFGVGGHGSSTVGRQLLKEVHLPKDPMLAAEVLYVLLHQRLTSEAGEEGPFQKGQQTVCQEPELEYTEGAL